MNGYTQNNTYAESYLQEVLEHTKLIDSNRNQINGYSEWEQGERLTGNGQKRNFAEQWKCAIS